MHLGNILRNTFRHLPHACAIKHGGQEYSFGDVVARVEQLAEHLKEKGVSTGDRVGLLVSNCPAFPVAYFATLWAGATVVPINPLLSDAEVNVLLMDCTPKILIAEKRFGERIRLYKSKGILVESIHSNPFSIPDLSKSKPKAASSLVHRENSSENLSAHQTAVILYTSGSTGQPKGVELTHSNLVLNARSVSEEKFSSKSEKNVLGPGHVGLASIPLSHAFGQTNLQNGIWFNGGALVFQSRFDPLDAIEKMRENQVTFFAGVPTMYFELVRAGRQALSLPRDLRFCVCGGAAVSDAIKSEFEQLFGVRIQESYGLTETSPMVSCQKIDSCEKSGCVGKPIKGVRVRVADKMGNERPHGEIGEIQVQGHNVFRQYYNNQQETDLAFDDGWLRTGDLGKLDADNEIRIIDRVKEVINRGGYQIYPREVENVILSVKTVETASVVGISDEKYGEQVVAFVTTSVETPDLIEALNQSVIAEIKSVCKKKLAAYKCPKFVVLLDEMPKGSTGKIDKIQLRKTADQLRPSLEKINP